MSLQGPDQFHYRTWLPSSVARFHTPCRSTTEMVVGFPTITQTCPSRATIRLGHFYNAVNEIALAVTSNVENWTLRNSLRF